MSNNFLNSANPNPFTANINKGNSIPNSFPNQNLAPSNSNTINSLISKPSGSGLNVNNNPFPSNANIPNNLNKEDKNENQENKFHLFSNAIRPNNISNSNASNFIQNNANQNLLGNSFQSAPQENLFQIKDNNTGNFNRQFSFSSVNDGQSKIQNVNLQNKTNSNIFNTSNNANDIFNNQKKDQNEDKIQNQNKLYDSKNILNVSSAQEKSNKSEFNNTQYGQNQNNVDNKFMSNNSFLQPKPTNKDSDKTNNTSFTGFEKKNQNSGIDSIANKLTEKSNESLNMKTNFTQVNNDPLKHELIKNTAIKKPSDQIKENRSIEDFKIDKLMSLSIDDLINKWKLELDNQVDKFEKAADSIKNFELNFQNQYDKVGHLSELINKITENGENTLNELTNISKEEDYIIDQLDCMERNLDKFFDIIPKNPNQNDKHLSIDDKIYSTALELDSNVKDIQKEIDGIQNNFNVQSENHAKKVENLKRFQQNNSGASFDEKDISDILNSYFDSLRALQLMMHSVESKVQDVSFDLNENKKSY